MDHNNKVETMSDVCSIISGSTEDDRYGSFCSPIISIEAITENHTYSDLSPLIPVQDINMEDLENSWNHIVTGKNYNEKNLDEQISVLQSNTNDSDHEDNIVNKIYNHSNAISPQQKLKIIEENIKLRSHKDESIRPKNKDNILSQDLSFKTSLEPNSQANISLIEDSQKDLFDLDSLSGQKLQSGENCLTQDMTCSVSMETPSPLEEDGQTTSSSGNKTCISQAGTCQLLDEKDGDILLGKDDGVSDTSSCTIPPNIIMNQNPTPYEESRRTSPRSLVKSCSYQPAVCEASGETNIKAVSSNDDVAAASINSSSTIPPNKNHKYSFKYKTRLFQLENDRQDKKSNNSNENQIIGPQNQKHNEIITAEQFNTSFSSQSTKQSSDLFISSMDVTTGHKTSQEMLQRSIDVKTEIKGSSHMMSVIESATQPESTSHVQTIQTSGHSSCNSQSKEEPPVRSIRKKKQNTESLLQEGNELIYKEHELKMSSLDRFDNLCNKIVSCLDGGGGSLPDSDVIGSYVHRYEFLISKMHAMHKDEKIKLCSSLNGAGLSKQKRKILKVRLEYLKLRHQTLMRIVNKYRKIKDRFETKEPELSQQSGLFSQELDQSQSLLDFGKRAEFEMPNCKSKLKERSQICSDDNKIEQGRNSQNISTSVTPMECVEHTKCTDGIWENEDDCVILSGCSNERHPVNQWANENIMTSSTDCSHSVPTENVDSQMHWRASNKVTITKATTSTFASETNTFQEPINQTRTDKCMMNVVSSHQTLANAGPGNRDTGTRMLPTKRKSAQKFCPPMKKKSGSMKMVSILTKPDFAIKSVERVIPKDFNKINKPNTTKQNDGSNNLRSTITTAINAKATNILSEINNITCIDDIVFTEFEDPALKLNKATKQINERHLQIQNPSPVTEMCVDNIFLTEFQDSSFTSSLPAKANDSRVPSVMPGKAVETNGKTPSNVETHEVSTRGSNQTGCQESDIITTSRPNAFSPVQKGQKSPSHTDADIDIGVQRQTINNATVAQNDYRPNTDNPNINTTAASRPYRPNTDNPNINTTAASRPYRPNTDNPNINTTAASRPYRPNTDNPNINTTAASPPYIPNTDNPNINTTAASRPYRPNTDNPNINTTAASPPYIPNTDNPNINTTAASRSYIPNTDNPDINTTAASRPYIPNTDNPNINTTAASRPYRPNTDNPNINTTAASRPYRPNTDNPNINTTAASRPYRPNTDNSNTNTIGASHTHGSNTDTSHANSTTTPGSSQTIVYNQNKPFLSVDVVHGTSKPTPNTFHHTEDPIPTKPPQQYCPNNSTPSLKWNDSCKDQNKALSSTLSNGPASPCSTQGSSLFPVSSKEIARRLQLQSWNASPRFGSAEDITESKYLTTKPAINDSFQKETYAYCKQAVSDTLTVGVSLPSDDDCQPKSITHVSVPNANDTTVTEQTNYVPPRASSIGPSSPCSTQGSSLFPVSSREIVRRFQSRQALTQLLILSPATNQNKQSLQEKGPQASCSQLDSMFSNSKRSLTVPDINIQTSIVSASLSLDQLSKPPKQRVSTVLSSITNENKHCSVKGPLMCSSQPGSRFSKSKGSSSVPNAGTPTVSVSMPLDQLSKSKPIQRAPAHLTLEPSAISINTIMTSSLCLPQKPNSSNGNPKPITKRSRKAKPKTASQLTQTSPEITPSILNVDFIQGKNNSIAMNCSNIPRHNVTVTDRFSGFDTTGNYTEHRLVTDCGSNQLIENRCSSTRKSMRQSTWCDDAKDSVSPHERASVYHNIINSLKTVLLISDQELIPADKGIPALFWEEDFADITMSKSVWDSVVEW